MLNFIPATAKAPQTGDNDPRFGHLLGQSLSKNQTPKVVILGFPSDIGVSRNGGRPGAAEAPGAIRQALYKLTPDVRCYERFCDLLKQTIDLGDVILSDDLQANQKRLGDIIAPFLKQNTVMIIIGGGHETAYGHFLGYANCSLPVSILNFDAHTDVRDLKDGKPHSGSPFRQALEHQSQMCKQYTVLGAQPKSVSMNHYSYIKSHGGDITWVDQLTRPCIEKAFSSSEKNIMTTFDLDALDQAYAPGVSAPATDGLSPTLWRDAAEQAGECRKVQSFDIVEMNPHFDCDGQTARLAASTIWHFFRGLTKRFFSL